MHQGCTLPNALRQHLSSRSIDFVEVQVKAELCNFEMLSQAPLSLHPATRFFTDKDTRSSGKMVALPQDPPQQFRPEALTCCISQPNHQVKREFRRLDADFQMEQSSKKIRPLLRSARSVGKWAGDGHKQHRTKVCQQDFPQPLAHYGPHQHPLRWLCIHKATWNSMLSSACAVLSSQREAERRTFFF